MKKFLMFSLLGIAFILTGCGTQAPASSNQAPAGTSGTTVAIQNFAFSPDVLTVTKGTTVTWTNDDSAPHQIKSETFNSTRLNKGDSYSFTFNQAGDFDYVCAIHSSMKGKIIVK